MMSINKAQRKIMREEVEKILAQIDWPPEKLCELAVRAALTVSKSPDGAEFRDWANDYLRGDTVNNFEMWSRLGFSIETFENYTIDDRALLHELKSAHSAYSQYFHGFSKGHPEEKLFLSNALINAKLAAIARGEKLEISEIIKDIKVKHETA